MIDMNQVLLLMNKNYRKNYKKAFKLKENEFAIKKDKRKSLNIVLFQFLSIITIHSIVVFSLFTFGLNFFVYSMVFAIESPYFFAEAFTRVSLSIVFMVVFARIFIVGFVEIFFPKETALNKQTKTFLFILKNKHLFEKDEKIEVIFFVNGVCNSMKLTIDEVINKLEGLIFNNEIILKFCSGVLYSLEEHIEKKQDEEEKQQLDKLNKEEKERSDKETKKYLDQLLEEKI